LAGLAEALRQAAPALTVDFTAAAKGLSFEDAGEVSRLGRRLWPAAAAALPKQPISGWAAATGLRAEDYPPLAGLCCGVWRHAEAMWDLLEEAEDVPPQALVRGALAGPAQENEDVFAAALALLMARAPRPGSIASVAAGLDPRTRLLAGRALDRVIEAGLPPLDVADPAGAAENVENLAEMLADLEASSLGNVPDRRDRLLKLRHQADLACRETFLATLESGLLAPLGALPDSVPEAEIMALEGRVRDLRRLLLACRRVGTPDTYDNATRAAVEGLMQHRTCPSGQGLTLVDLARLVEILGGREAADRLLAQAKAQ